MNRNLEIAWNGVASSLRSYLRSRVPEAIAEDLLQDVFVKAFKQGEKLREVKNLEGWLFFIARNRVVDYYRSAKPSEVLPQELVAETEEQPLKEVEEGLREAFRKLVEGLPEPYREALVLTEYQGLSQAELASNLGISISGAKSRVQRARAKLKEAILECCALEFDRRGNVIDCEGRNETCSCDAE